MEARREATSSDPATGRATFPRGEGFGDGEAARASMTARGVFSFGLDRKYLNSLAFFGQVQLEDRREGPIITVHLGGAVIVLIDLFILSATDVETHGLDAA